MVYKFLQNNPVVIFWLVEKTFHWVVSGNKFAIMNVLQELATKSLQIILAWVSQKNYVTNDAPKHTLKCLP